MPRSFWSILAIAVVAGGIAVLVALPFTTNDEEPAAVENAPGLVRVPLGQPPPPSATPTPTPAPVRRRASKPASAPAPAPQQPGPGADQLPDGAGFNTAKDAIEQSQEQPQQPQP